MHRDSLPEAISFASKILHRFAEYDIHGNESVLRSELIALLEPAVQYLQIRIQIEVGRIVPDNEVIATALRPLQIPEIVIPLLA
jgi:hypothetical protein